MTHQARWSELLADLNLNVQYLPGTKNTVPDALSRRPDLKMAMLAALVDTTPSRN